MAPALGASQRGEAVSCASNQKVHLFLFFFSNGAVGDGRGWGGVKWEQLLCASSDLIPLTLREAAMETSDDVVVATEDSGKLNGSRRFPAHLACQVTSSSLLGG